MAYPSKVINIGPIQLTTSVANVLNTAITSLAGPVGMTLTQPSLIIRSITIANRNASAVNCSLWKGATGASAAGTEFIIPSLTSLAGLSSTTYYPGSAGWRLDSTDFLTGQAGTTTSLTLNFSAEILFS